MDFGFLGVTTLLSSLWLCTAKPVHISVALHQRLGRYSSDLLELDSSWCRWAASLALGGAHGASGGRGSSGVCQLVLADLFSEDQCLSV